MRPAPGHVRPDQAAGNHEVNNLVHHIEEDRKQETSGGIFHVQLDSQRGRAESHDRLRNSVESDGMMGQRVLQDADQTARQQASQRTAPRRRETDGDQQRKIEDGEKRKPQRQPRLEENGGQRNLKRRRKTEAVNLNLLSRCVSNGHVIADYPARRVAVWVGPPASRAWEKLSWRRLRLGLQRSRRKSRERMRVAAFFAQRAGRCWQKLLGTRVWAWPPSLRYLARRSAARRVTARRLSQHFPA